MILVFFICSSGVISDLPLNFVCLNLYILFVLIFSFFVCLSLKKSTRLEEKYQVIVHKEIRSNSNDFYLGNRWKPKTGSNFANLKNPFSRSPLTLPFSLPPIRGARRRGAPLAPPSGRGLSQKPRTQSPARPPAPPSPRPSRADGPPRPRPVGLLLLGHR